MYIHAEDPMKAEIGRRMARGKMRNLQVYGLVKFFPSICYAIHDRSNPWNVYSEFP